MKGRTCGHGVLVGAWCQHCGTTVQADAIAQMAMICAGCGLPILARDGAWTRCLCGTQTTVLP